MAHFSKREFLKLMGGFGLGLVPFVGCYNKPSEKVNYSLDPKPKAEEIEDATASYSVTQDDVVLLERNDENFQEYNTSYNKRISLIPKYIAICKTTLGVKYAIQKAKEAGLPICIKSGGHSFEGFSSNNDGMVINLSQMKRIDWLDNNDIRLEAGLKLSELHEQIYDKGRLISAGSCGGVGIAGLTLGGGYGFFSRKYGLTCDQLIDAEVVTADEKVIHAKENPDLLWALRGGGNGNFGVVTKFIFRTEPIPKTFSSYTIKIRNLTVETLQSSLSKFFEVTTQFPLEAFGAFVLNGTTLTLLVTNYGDENIADQVSEMAFGNTISSSLDKPLVPALKRYYGRKDPLYFKNASCGYFNSFEDLAQPLPLIFEEVTKHRGIIFQINTLGGNINRPEFVSQSCYPHRDMNYLGELQGYYEKTDQEPNILEGFSAIQQILKESGVEKHYRNYPDINFEDWEHAYFGDNYAKLQHLKAMLDPEDVFQYPQSIKS